MQAQTQDDSTDEVEFDVGANDIDKQNMDIASLDNPYLVNRVENLMEENGWSEERAIQYARNNPDENDVEAGTILSIVADSIYESPKAPVREYIANAETACLRTEQEFNDLHSSQPKSEYQPTIQITWERANNRFTIQDNGLGISTEKMEKICGVVGRTDMLDTGDMSGMWGMGMYSIFGDQFAGHHGSATITTHSRESDEDYSVVFMLGNKEPNDNKLGEHVYGTRVSTVVQDLDFSMRNAVKEYAEWSRVTVSYREFDEDGKEVYNEEWGRKKLDADVDDAAFSMVVENEAFRAVCYPNASKKTLLVSMPISRNDNSIRPNRWSAPYHFDLRIKQEGGQIANGWAVGKIPIPEDEYEELDHNDRENYVKEKWVDPHRSWFGYDYFCLPKPTPDRDRLNRSESEKFSKRVSEMINKEYKKKVSDFFEGVTTRDDVANLDQDGISTLRTAKNKLPTGGNLEDYYDTDLTDRAKDYIEKLDVKVSLAPRNRSAAQVTKKKYRDKKRISYIEAKVDDGGDVYMGQRITEKKARIAWELDDNNQVVQVSSSKYDEYAEIFGWKVLHEEIDLNKVDEYDIPDDVKKQIKNKDKSSSSSYSKRADRVAEKEINLSRNGARQGRKKVEAQDLETYLSDDEHVKRSSYSWDNLTFVVLFPTSHDEKHTDNYHLAGETPVYGGYTSVASCTNEVYEYVKDVDGVVTKEEYFDKFTTIPIRRVDGSVTTIDEAKGDDAKVINVDYHDWKIINDRNESLDDGFRSYYDENNDIDVNDDDYIIFDSGNYNYFTQFVYDCDIFEYLEMDKEYISLGRYDVYKYVIDEMYFPNWDRSEYPEKVEKSRTNSYGGDRYYKPSNELIMYKNAHDKGLSPDELTDDSFAIGSV